MSVTPVAPSGAVSSRSVGIASAAECTSDVWNRVVGGGEVVAGVKADYKSWGFRNEAGELAGIEIDMASEAARVMGVDVEPVPGPSSNRMRFLGQGKRICASRPCRNATTAARLPESCSSIAARPART